MAVHGKQGRVRIDGFDLSEYVKSVNLDTSNEVVDVTTFGKDSKVYIAGLNDATLTTEGVHDEDKTVLDDLFEGIKATNAVVSYYPFNDAAGNNGFSFQALRSAYALASSITDAVNFSFGSQVTDGVSNVVSIIPLTEYTGANDSAGLDLASGSASGAIVYIHVTGVSDEADIIIEHSNDNGVGDAYAEWAKVEDVDTVDGYIIDSAVAIKRWVRVKIAGIGVAETIELQVGIQKY
jgi:hypothetical protein